MPLALGSCYCYQAVAVDRRYSLSRPGGEHDPGQRRAARFRVAVKRVFARRCSSAPAAVINNRAVDLAREGRYGQAEILFREVLAEEPDPAAYNNLGVICELAGNRDEAFTMYREACRLEPYNETFRANFLTFAGYREREP